MTEGKQCAHDGCTCKSSMDSDYCSAHCMEAAKAGKKTQQCQCGHAECHAPHISAPR